MLGFANLKAFRRIRGLRVFRESGPDRDQYPWGENPQLPRNYPSHSTLLSISSAAHTHITERDVIDDPALSADRGFFLNVKLAPAHPDPRAQSELWHDGVVFTGAAAA